MNLIVPWETGKLYVEFNYYRGYPGTRTDPPGPPEVTLTAVMTVPHHDDVTFIFIDDDAMRTKLEDLALKMVRDNDRAEMAMDREED